MNEPLGNGLTGIEDLYVEEDEVQRPQFDVGRIVRALRTRKWLLLGVALGVFAVFAYKAARLVPIYSTTAKIWIRAYDDQDKASLGRAHVYELTSQTFARRVAAKFGLALELQGQYRQSSLREVFAEFSTTDKPVQGFYTLEIDAGENFVLSRKSNEGVAVVDSGSVSEIVDSSRTVNGFTFRLNRNVDSPTVSIPFRVKSLESATNIVRSKVKTDFSRSMDVMAFTMTDTDPVRLANMVNYIAEIFIEETRSMRERDGEAGINVLEGRVRAAEEKHKSSAEAVRKFKQRYPFLEPTGLAMLGEELGRQQGHLEGFPERRKRLKTMLEELGTDFSAEAREEKARFVVRSIAGFEGLAADPQLQVTVRQLDELENQWQESVVERGYTKYHELYQELDSKIAETYRKILEAGQRYLADMSQQEENLRTGIARLKAQRGATPTLVAQLAELQGQAETDAKLYNDLLHDLEEQRIGQSVETQKIGFLDEASIPHSPVNMGKKKTLALGGILGIILGSLVAVGLEFLDRRIKTAEDVKRYLKLQILGVVPRVDFKDLNEYDDSQRARHVDKLLVTHDYSPTPMGEAYRSLRTNLLYSKRSGKIRTLVITSIAPDEGKSFTAANLAIIFAQQKSNTVLIDGDLRRGVLHNTFGSTKEPGLTNYLSSTATLSEILNETHIPNLSLVSCGSLIPNPSELLGSLQMRRFIEEVRRRFDLVIFDSPPLNAATDAIVIGTQVDAVPIVLRAGHTNRDVAKERLEMFRNVPVNVLGAILNGAESYSSETYSYYHY